MAKRVAEIEWVTEVEVTVVEVTAVEVTAVEVTAVKVTVVEGTVVEGTVVEVTAVEVTVVGGTVVEVTAEVTETQGVRTEEVMEMHWMVVVVQAGLAEPMVARCLQRREAAARPALPCCCTQKAPCHRSP